MDNLKEYGTGAGGRAPVKGGQNPRQAQRIRFDDDEDERNWYASQNRYGAEGGHDIGDTYTGNYPNRTKFPIYEKLKNYIKQQLEEIESDDYGDATLTTQGQSIHRAPGVWEELQEQVGANPRITQLQKAIQDRTKDNQDDQLEIQQIGIDDAIAAAAQANAAQGPAIADAEKQIFDLVSKKKELIGQKTQLVDELNQLNAADILDLEQEQLERKDALPAEIRALEDEIKKNKEALDKAKESSQNLLKQKNLSAAQQAAGIAQMKKALSQTKTQMKKAQSQQQRVAESLFEEYQKLRKDSNLMKNIDSYKREILFEGAMVKFFKLFDEGKSNEEILRIYAERGIVVPEQFVGKARKKHEGLKHDKLDLEELERETKNFKKIPLVDEDEIEEKILSTRLMNEEIKFKNLIQEKLKKYPIPQEIEYALTKTLKMNPLIRFVKNLKALNSIPESYRVFLLNNQYFDIIYESFSLMVKIGTKEYFIGDIAEKNYAIKHINRLMTEPIIKTGEDEEGVDTGGETPSPSPPSPPPPPPTPEPEPEA